MSNTEDYNKVFNKAILATEICGLLILPFFGASPAPT